MDSIVFEVAAEQMFRDGYVFYLSENGILMTKAVSVKYLQTMFL